MEIVKGKIIDIIGKKIFPGEITIINGIIHSIRHSYKVPDVFILPGFIDSHAHIESSMLVPAEFAKAAVRHGTIATVSDPHEIANVLGIAGITYMLENAKQTPFKFYFGAPACVPATIYETSGATIGLEETEYLLSKDEIKFLSEVMNYPDVISENITVLEKIRIAKKYGKVIDGHAPGLSGENLRKYIDVGISTDHECTSLDEAVEKLKNGMKILVREGSAAKNLDELAVLIDKYPDQIMLCTDDIHPDDLESGHINLIVKKCIGKGLNLFNILKTAIINPALHYNIDPGLIKEGERCNFIIIDSLENFNVLSTYIDGKKVYDGEKLLFNENRNTKINYFNARMPAEEELKIQAVSNYVKLIEAKEGSLITGKSIIHLAEQKGKLIADPANNVLKIAVINRYLQKSPVLGFIKGFGIKKGAIAGSISHDSHNIISIGSNDIDLRTAITKIIQMQGGLVVVEGDKIDYLELPVAGLMSDQDVFTVAKGYRNLLKRSKELGSQLSSAFMTMSFMALLVIPELKIGDKGLFDVDKFQITSLYT